MSITRTTYAANSARTAITAPEGFVFDQHTVWPDPAVLDAEDLLAAVRSLIARQQLVLV